MKQTEQTISSNPHHGKINIGVNTKAGTGNHSEAGLQLGDLFQLIFKKLQPLYLIDCAALLLYDANVTKIRQAFLAEYHPATNQIITEVVNDGITLQAIAAEVASFEYPVLKTRQEWEEDYSENHCLLNQNADYVFHCYIPLEIDNTILGTLELHNRHKALSTEGLAFCSNMADLLAEVVHLLLNHPNGSSIHNAATATVNGLAENKSPITAPAEAAVTAAGHTLLLNLSTALSGAKDKEEMDTIIRRYLKHFNIQHYAIRLIDTETDTHGNYLSSIADDQSVNRTALLATDADSADDVVFEAITTAHGPVIIHLDSAAQPLPGYLQFWVLNKHTNLIAAPLTSGGKTVGALLMGLPENHQMGDADMLLLKGVANQLSVVIAAMQARHQITIQLAEISDYKQQLEAEQLFLMEDAPAEISYPGIIGRAPQMQPVFQLLNQVAGSESTVLILGETGTGKELIAKAIHDHSVRKDHIMIKVNCAAIPPNLIESELFGHEKGSFTGATERRLGKFELADNSTLFLDEIGELSLELQVKLLRVLQEKEIERVGGTSTIKTDVRIVAATNRDLLTEVAEGRFRQDLYYRLNVFPVRLPALRDRKEDIPLLADYFMKKYVQKAGKKITGLSQKALQDMRSYHWPGNVRELEHLIERQILLTRGQMIREVAIPAAARAMVIKNDEVVTVKTIDENERDHIFSVLQLCGGKVSGPDGAAKLLGVPATTLNSKIKRLKLTKTHLY